MKEKIKESKREMEKILQAANFAAQKHAGQKRKNKTQDPYINHPIEVAYFLSQIPGVDQNTIIAGLLHDTVEDTNTTQEELEREFGVDVANIVMECTDDKSLPKVTRKMLQIKHARLISYSAKLVKLADKASNLTNLQTDPPTSWSPEVIKGYAMWCFAVNLELINSTKVIPFSLIEKLDEIFQSFGIDSLDEEILKNYYIMISE